MIELTTEQATTGIMYLDAAFSSLAENLEEFNNAFVNDCCFTTPEEIAKLREMSEAMEDICAVQKALLEFTEDDDRKKEAVQTIWSNANESAATTAFFRNIDKKVAATIHELN